MPTQVFLGLTSGNIFFFPNFFPKKNAPVSHIQTERKSARVILNPISGKFLNSDNDPSINPNQTNEKTKIDMLSNGVSFFRNISNAMAVKVNPIINVWMGISQLIPGILPICNRAKNNNKTEITGCPFFVFDRGVISRALK